MLGGTTAFSCAISSILAGIITGYIGRIFQKHNRTVTPKYSAFLSVGIVSVEMVMILFIVKDGWNIVKTIAMPMIFVNGFGSFILLSMVQAIFATGRECKGITNA